LTLLSVGGFALLLVAAALFDGFFVHLPAGTDPPNPLAESVGVIHVHTTAAHKSVELRRELQRSANLQAVLTAAGEAGLSFVTITDHNYVSHLWPDSRVPPGLTVLFGEEVSLPGGHFLAFDVPADWRPPPHASTREVLASAHAAGITTFIAHPYGNGSPWRDWNTKDFDGIEIWNEDAVWRGNNLLDLGISLTMYHVNPELGMVRLARTPQRNFAKWDELLRDRPVVGICASDAHGGVWLGHGTTFHFPAYGPVFRLARQHLLLPRGYTADPNRPDAGVLLEALKNGHSYCGLDALSPASGFVQSVSGGASAAGPGDSVSWTPGSVLHVSVPQSATIPRIQVFRDGRQFAEAEGWSLDAPLDGPGRYRTEVFLRAPGITSLGRWTMWIFSNPTYVLAAPAGGRKPWLPGRSPYPD
jgi:hypothetical protein